jgi:hypothetical protein
MVEIADRRNELAGNLSLHQELGFIEKIDQLLEEGRLADDGRYKQITVRVIELSRSRRSRSLGAAVPRPGKPPRPPPDRPVRARAPDTDLQVDPTRKQVARDRVTWTVRAQGRAEAELRDGKVVALRLGA